MSRGSKWIPLDKYLAQEFKSIKREFSMIEAMFSYQLDVDRGKEGTISGYSKLWGWSRNKVRRFVKCIRTDEGHMKDSKRTHEGHPIHFIDKDLWGKEDSKRTDEGQVKDTCHDTTTNPNPNPEEEIPPLPPKPKKKKKVFIPPTKEEVINFFLENEYDGNKGANAFDFYAEADWHDSRGAKVKNWKQKMRGVWFKDDNKVVQNKFNGSGQTMTNAERWVQSRMERENGTK